MHNRIIVCILCLALAITSVRAEDVRLTISEASINNLAAALCQAKCLSFGHVDFSQTVEYYYTVRTRSLTIAIQPGNVFTATITVDAAADVGIEGLLHYKKTVSNEVITVSGTLSLQAAGDGYKIVFAPQPPIQFSEVCWLSDVLNFAGSGFFGSFPEISTTAEMPLLAAAATEYFTSSVPTLSTTQGQISLSFTLIAGPRFVTAYNDVNQSMDIGQVQDEEGTGNYVQYDSPKRFEWNTGTVQKLQTPVDLLDASNGKNKYRNWFKNSSTIAEQDVAPRRIELTVGTDDDTYRAEFDRAQHVQLSNLLIDAGTGGGTVTYENTTEPTIDNYDYSHATQTHPINTTVANPTLGSNWVFQRWSDGGASQSRQIVVDQDINLQALYKGHLTSSSSQGLGSGNQRKVVVNGYPYAVYASAGSIWFTKYVGSGWSNEVLVPAFYGNQSAKNPSIAWTYRGGVSRIHVVWEETQLVGSDRYQVVCYVNSTDGGTTWGEPQTLAGQNYEYALKTTSEATPSEATPVVDGLQGAAMIIWRAGDPTQQGTTLYVHTEPGTSPINYTQVPQTTNASCGSPSLAFSGQGNYHLVYRKNSQILYQEFSVPLESPYTPTFIGSPTVISGTYTGCDHPSIAASALGTIATVAWESSTSGGRVVACTGTKSGSWTWSTPVALSHGTHVGSAPSVGIDNDAQTATIVFKCDAHIAQSTQTLAGGTWSGVQDLGQGASPNITDNTSGPPLISFAQGAAAPYNIRIGTYQQYLQTLAEENKSLYVAAGNNNSSRHLVLAGGKFHELFISAGEIFYRRRDQASGTWEKTLRISDGAGGATLDALCHLPDGSLHAVWEESIGGTRFRIKYSRSSDGNVWSAPYVLENDDTVSTNQWSTYPVIGSALSNQLVMAHCYDGGLRYKTSTDGGLTWQGTWSTIAVQPGYRSSVWFLSMTTIGNTLWLSYDYRMVGVYQRSFNGTSWTAESAVSSGTGTVQGRVSSIACDMSVTQPMVAFSAQTNTETEYRTVIRHGNPPGWFEQLPRVAAGVSDYYPSLTSSFYIAALGWHPIVASYTSDNRIRLWAVNGEGWYSRFLATGSAYASLAENREPTNYDAIVQYTSQEGPPYTVGLWAGATLGKLEGASGDSLKLAHHRRIVIGDSSAGAGGGEVSYEVAAPRMVLSSGDEVTLRLKRHDPRAVLTRSADTLLSYLESEEFDVPANARSLMWKLSVSMPPSADSLESGTRTSKALADRSCTVQLADSRGTHLASTSLAGEDAKTGLLIDLSKLKGKKVHLALKDLAPLKKGSVVLGIGDVYCDEADDTTTVLAKVAPSALPTVDALSEAYPNPFNPTTQLDFALPVAGSVSLVVYDILGREVATLARGTYEAGYHSVRWDAAAKASGMYFVRLMVRDDLGGVSFTKVNKLLLMK